MVKLASARESRVYGPRVSGNRWEYMNAGVYVFATILLMGGFAAQLSKEPRSGLVLLLIALLLVIAVNTHDLLAHLAAFDFRLRLMEYDVQLLLVEFAAPIVQAIGALLLFLAVLLIFIQAEKGYGYFKLERHALNMLIAGPALWLLGSIHNACQIYERADGHVQILQQSVHIPFFMGSLLFLVGAVLNSREQARSVHHGVHLLDRSWAWLGISGGVLLFLGGLMNVVKVFKMQQIDGLRLEKLRGGAQERLLQEREGQGCVSLIIEDRLRKPQMTEDEILQKRRAEEERLRTRQVDEERLRKRQAEEARPLMPTPYKDVLVGQT